MELNEHIGFQIGKTFKLMHALLNERFEASDCPVSFEVWIKLFMFSRENGITQKDLADLSGIHKATITRIVDQLEENGYVLRKQDANDRRQNVIKVTDEGFGIIEKYTPILNEVEVIILKNLSSGDVSDCFRVLNQVKENCTNNLKK